MKSIERKSNTVTLITLFKIHNYHFLKLVSIGERAHASHQKYERSKELIKSFIKRPTEKMILISAWSQVHSSTILKTI
jgi:hypothetical protein